MRSKTMALMIFIAGTVAGYNHGLTADTAAEAQAPPAPDVSGLDVTESKILAEGIYPLVPNSWEYAVINSVADNWMVQDVVLQPMLDVTFWYIEEVAVLVATTPVLQTSAATKSVQVVLSAGIVSLAGIAARRTVHMLEEVSS